MPRPPPDETFTITHMNRITRYLEEAPEEPRYGDFWVVAMYPFGCFHVNSVVAGCIRAQLDRWVTPKWITFHDRVGSLVRVRSSHIRSIVECTTEQRAADRRLDRAREEEEKADRRPWDDD